MTVIIYEPLPESLWVIRRVQMPHVDSQNTRGYNRLEPSSLSQCGVRLSVNSACKFTYLDIIAPMTLAFMPGVLSKSTNSNTLSAIQVMLKLGFLVAHESKP